MKAKLLALVMVGFFFIGFLIGCSGFQVVTSGSENVMIKIAAIKLGGEFVKKNPGEIKKVNTFAEALKDGEISVDVYDVVKDYLASRVSSDPVDRACLEEILSMIQVKNSETGVDGLPFDNDKLQVAIEGFLFGMNIGG